MDFAAMLLCIQTSNYFAGGMTTTKGWKRSISLMLPVVMPDH